MSGSTCAVYPKRNRLASRRIVRRTYECCRDSWQLYIGGTYDWRGSALYWQSDAFDCPSALLCQYAVLRGKSSVRGAEASWWAGGFWIGSDQKLIVMWCAALSPGLHGRLLPPRPFAPAWARNPQWSKCGMSVCSQVVGFHVCVRQRVSFQGVRWAVLPTGEQEALNFSQRPSVILAASVFIIRERDFITQ